MNPNAYAEKVGKMGKRLVDAAKKSRKRAMEQGREIMRYGYAPDYGFEYQKKAPKAFFQAKVALTSEAFAVFGPYLFPQVPVRTVNPRPWVEGPALRRAEIIGDYLNYTPGETGLRDDARRAIIEAIGYGRGVLWVGRDPQSGLMTGMYDSVRNFGTDPDAKTPRDRKYVWRRRVLPRFEAIQMWPKAKTVLTKEPVYESRATDADGIYQWEQTDTASECVCVYELYLKVGLHNFKGGSELVKMQSAAPAQPGGQPAAAPAGGVPMDDAPRKYVVTENGALVDIGEWEVPFFEDGLFPCNLLDLLDDPEGDWPHSPLEAGLGWQRAINWVTTMLMGKFRFTSRTIGALARNGHGVSDRDKERILRVGSDIDILEITVNGETKTLQQFVQQFDWNHDYLNWGMKFLELMEEKHQKATGLYDILYTGDTGRQMRSAQEAQLKERNSRSRLDDMRDRVAEWMAREARMEALAARFLHTRDEIAAILGPQAGADWGFLVRPDQANVEQWAMENMQAGLPPEEAIAQAQQQAAQAVDLNSWRKELDYTIEAGSMRRHDIDAQIDTMRELFNQLVPVQMQSPDPMERAMAYDTTATFFEMQGLPPKEIARQREMANALRQMAMQPPPMPPPGAQPPRAPKKAKVPA